MQVTTMEDSKDLEKSDVLAVPGTPTKPGQALKVYVRRKSVNRLSRLQDISSSSDSNMNSGNKEKLEEKCFFPGDCGFVTMKKIVVESETNQGAKSSESKSREDSQFVDGKEKIKKNTKVTTKKQRFHIPRILEDGKKPRDPATIRLRTISRKRKKKEKDSEEEIIIEPRTPEKQSLPKRRKPEKTKRNVVRPLVFDQETVIGCLELSRNSGPNFPTARRKMTIVRRTDFHGLIAISFPMPIWKKQSKRSNRRKNLVRWANIALLEEASHLVTSHQKVNHLSTQANASLQTKVLQLVQQMKPSLSDISLQIKENKRDLLLKGKQEPSLKQNNSFCSTQTRDQACSELRQMNNSNEKQAHQLETPMISASCAVPKRRDKKTKDTFEHLIQQIKYQKDHGLSSLADVPLHIEDTLMKSDSCVSPKQRIQGTKDIAKLIKGLSKLNINKRVTTAISQRKKDKQLVIGKVDLDPETIKKWELLMMNDIPDRSYGNEEEESKLKGEREVLQGVDLFIDRMHLVQGNRRFKKWKSSVVDSIVGVFLTQNVCDNLSSNAFMSVAAKFPADSPKDSEDLPYYIEEPLVVQNHEATYVENNDSKFISLSEASIQEVVGEHEKTAKRKNEKTGIMEDEKVDWKSLKKKYTKEGSRDNMHMDCVDWNAVRLSGQQVFEDTIRKRGQFRILSGRILKFLNNEAEENGIVDLEWLRDAPSDLVKRYLLEIEGIGLKSAECVRLLGLRHSAFPVDTNVGRIVVRLGWVPLEPLPNGVQIHQLSQYPSTDLIQKYLWPRLYKLPQETLYELHYQMITFGKVFCTKVLPNCNACPMKSECKYFASAYVSSKVLLEGPEENTKEPTCSDDAAVTNMTPNMTLIEECASPPECNDQTNSCVPRVEFPSSPNVEIEIPSSPNVENSELIDIEDFPCRSLSQSHVGIPNFDMDMDAFKENVKDALLKSGKLPNISDDDVSKALVALTPENACIPFDLPEKRKFYNRLRTEHVVYVLPDDHELLVGFERREADDHIPYLLTIWQPGETSYTFKPPKKKCELDGSKLCEIKTCSYCWGIREKNSNIFRGTILIPCRTAMRGWFPLNGTYFQTNEVFADHETSLNPIVFRRELCEGLERRALYCGSSVTPICRFLDQRRIGLCFTIGYLCIRAFDRMTRNPEDLVRRLHTPPDERGQKFMREFDE